MMECPGCGVALMIESSCGGVGEVRWLYAVDDRLFVEDLDEDEGVTVGLILEGEKEGEAFDPWEDGCPLCGQRMSDLGFPLRDLMG
jgi:hypothetical protein